jgi:hypothetical protein
MGSVRRSKREDSNRRQNERYSDNDEPSKAAFPIMHASLRY